MNLDINKQSLGFVKYYAFILGVLSITFYLGYVTAAWYQDKLKRQTQVMQQSLDNLLVSNQALHSRVNTIQIALEVATLANQQNQQSLQDSLARENTLKEQLGFYQRVMAPELTQDGFVVERIEVSPRTTNNNYSLSMVLLQHENIKTAVQGELKITLNGSIAGKAVSFDIAELQDEPKYPLSFGFKYFQVINMNITLPDNFDAQNFDIVADVFKYKRKQGSYSTVILWSEAYNQIE